MNDVERRALIAKVPHVRNLLGAVFNNDWDLDHEDAEAAYASVFDDLGAEARAEYEREAQVLDEHPDLVRPHDEASLPWSGL